MRGKGVSFSFFVCFVLVTTVFWGMLIPASPAFGEKKNLPPRAISVAPEYTGIIVERGEDVNLDLTVTNRGQRDESIELALLSVPKGWKAWIKSYSFGVTGVHVASDSTKSLTLKAAPDEEVVPGKYVFKIKAQTQDRKLTSVSQLLVTVKEKEKEETEGISIVTSYPVLQGPSDGRFEFSLEVDNNSDVDSVFNLSAKGPENWEVNFKPAYEEKFISSLRIKANQNQTMAVEVKPHPLAEPGRYPVTVHVSSPDAKAEAELSVVLTGTYKLDVGTVDGLLSLSAIRGKEANLSFYVKNNGSAAHNHVRFLSFKPENWDVKFTPEDIQSLAPGDVKQVELNVTPSNEALVGDYSVGISIEGEKVTEDLEFRVTVRASTAWGWVGVGMIVLVIAGLVGLFVRLGRR